MTVADLFEEQVARTPHATAVTDQRHSLTYAELDTRANRLANELTLATEQTVAICLPRSADLVIAMLAVLKAGGTFVLIDPRYPAERRAAMAANTSITLTTAESDGSATPPARDLSGDNAAYVVYTSGSTGTPKGVVNTHRGLANRLLAAVHGHNLGPGDRLLQATRVGFDPAVFQLLVMLVAGGTVVIAPDGTEQDPAALVRLLVDERITALELVPSMLRVLLDEPGSADVKRLRWLTSAGEALHADVCDRAYEVFQTEVWNVYGPAECAIGATEHQYVRGTSGAVPLGAPLENVKLAVLEDGEPVKPGGTGEIHLGGPGLARGYLGAPALTAEKFIPAENGERWYRTGDLARVLPQGGLEFVGRVDNQVKISGVRVEPEEIEAVLAGHPDVRAAAVIPVADGGGNVRLVASVVGTPDADTLRKYLRARLPESYLPSVFQHLDELPLTSNGKVDRAALALTNDVRRPPHRAPRTPFEHLVVQAWSEVLGIERIGLDDDFFQLGGYSLLLIRVAAKLRALSGRRLPVRQLFTASTPAAQAKLIGDDGTAIKPVARTGDLPLSFSQQQLWILDQLNPSSPEYTMPIAIRLDASANRRKVNAVLSDLAARHEILRTRYPVIDGRPVQQIDDEQDIDLTLVKTRPHEQAAAVAAHFARGFDLTRGPVWRALLAEGDGQGPLLVITVHHIACDGWSVVTLRREFDELWAAHTEGREPNLPPMTVQYADFAAWQREREASGALDDQLDYWRAHLADLPRLDLPTDRPHPPVRDPRGAAFSFSVPAHVTRAVLNLGKQRGATPYMTLLAAYVALLSRYSGQTDIPVGTPVAGRLRDEVAGIVGCFLNTVVLRCDTTGDPTFLDLVDRVRDTARDAQAAQEVPFDKLVGELLPDRDLSRNPLAQVLFDLHDSGVTAASEDPSEVWMLLDAWRGSKAELNLTVEILPSGQCSAVLEYSTALFDPVTVHRFAEHYVKLLSSIAAEAGGRISDLEILPPRERSTVLTAWNDRTATRPPVAIPDLFAAQAARTPNAVALVAGSQSLTYAELDEQANKLAAGLVALGAGPETVVGVCLDRSIDLVVSFLGIWKAGAAYVPLDPAFPADRLSYVVGDAGAKYVLTHERHADALATADATPLYLDDPATRRSLEARPPLPWGRTDLDTLAYVMYTSGSTGRPKGVLVDHRGLQNYLMWTVEGYAGTGTGGTPLFSSTAYDMVVPDLYTALVMGQPVHLLPPDFEPTQLGRLLTEAGPFTFIKLTPGHLDLLCDQLSPDEAANIASMLAVGADSFPAAVLDRWLDLAGPHGPRMLNEYGPTEISVANSTYPITGAERGEVVPIGRPIPNTTMYVLDEHGNPAPLGVPGELYVGGAGVARGYLNKPGLTARCFVPDPFSITPGARLYRTGDRARLRADGHVEFLGRNDDQIKLRGYRIEPAEIVAALTARPEIRDALVLAEGTGATKRLVAYVASDADVDLDALRDHCVRVLPSHQVPASFVVIERIPLNANGKVDRAALPKPPEAGTVHTGPRDELEEHLAGVWTELLELESEVDVKRNFFHLGGNSILAAKLVSRIESGFALSIPLRAVFEHPTIAEIAALIEQKIRDEIAQLSDAELQALTEEG
ncbi:amino acid adenylation domain-containing protein [Amycolatopsis xylanica]|uniref:Amino acid adenylation domain-containing protein n=1 Tax=Amycolatopsis xylanica TaxID=589385 RepID=A0A1H3DBA4_9PSEU|nr:non-ribosomal peptide synthetase [Amycolatopsis xylanica]SDX63590.1 amino acid adenylation domain-containing protein [Amycolatopsis xylanica]